MVKEGIKYASRATVVGLTAGTAQGFYAAKDLRQYMKFLKALVSGKNSKISQLTAYGMGGFAAVIDALQIVLTGTVIGALVSPILTVIAWITFYVWFTTKGIPFFGTRKVVTQIIGNVIELIPAIDAVPGLLLMTLAMIIIVRLEEASAKVPEVGKMLGVASDVKNKSKNSNANKSDNNVLKSKRTPQEQAEKSKATAPIQQPPLRFPSAQSTPRQSLPSSNIVNLRHAA